AALIAVLAWAMKPAGQTGGGRGGFARGAGGERPVPVRAVAATTGTVDVTVDALGTVAALNLILAEKKVELRPEFCIESYLNDPRVTPEDQLKTDLLVPIT